MLYLIIFEFSLHGLNFLLLINVELALHAEGFAKAFICFREPVKSLPKRPVETGKYANVYNELTDVGLPLDVLASDIFDESGKGF